MDKFPAMVSVRVSLLVCAAAVALTGCFDDLRDESCQSDSDCFRGSSCLNNVCVSGGDDVGDDGIPDTGDVREMDGGVEDVDTHADTGGNPGMDADASEDVPDDVGAECPRCFDQVVSGAASNHVCATTQAGQAYCWGANHYAQLGDPDRHVQRHAPVTVAGFDGDVQELRLGATHSCARTSDELFCWGDNSHGQLARLGGATSIAESVLSGTGVTGVAAGRFATCAIERDGGIRCVGLNASGQLGAPPERVYSSFEPLPVSVPPVSGPVDAGHNFACAVVASGNDDLRCWGANDRGQLGNMPIVGCEFDCPNPTPLGVDVERPLEVTVGGHHACALQIQGRAKCWGANDRGQVGAGVNDDSPAPPVDPGRVVGWDSLSAGFEHTCGISLELGPANPIAFCWGDNAADQVGGPTAMVREPRRVVGNFRAIAAGDAHTCAIAHPSGEIECWGANERFQLGVDGPTQTPNHQRPGVTGASRVAAGDEHSCAVVGTEIQCWGANEFGQLGDGVPIVRPEAIALVGSHFEQLATGDRHTCGRRGDRVFCWGLNKERQLAAGDQVYTNRPTEVPMLDGVAEVVGGSLFTCARTHAGAVYCWGANYCGRLGLGAGEEIVRLPTAVDLDAPATDLAAGNDHVCAVADGELWCWGVNDAGEAGDELSTEDCFGTPVVTTPKRVRNIDYEVRSVGAGADHTCTVNTRNELHCFGSNQYGQLGNPLVVQSSTPLLVEIDGGVKEVYGGEIHACALTTQGDVYCWGPTATLGTDATDRGCVDGTCQQTPTRVTSLSEVRSLTLGRYHSCAVDGDGDVLCWGNNTEGELGTGGFAWEARPTAIRDPRP